MSSSGLDRGKYARVTEISFFRSEISNLKFETQKWKDIPQIPFRTLVGPSSDCQGLKLLSEFTANRFGYLKSNLRHDAGTTMHLAANQTNPIILIF